MVGPGAGGGRPWGRAPWNPEPQTGLESREPLVRVALVAEAPVRRGGGTGRGCRLGAAGKTGGGGSPGCVWLRGKEAGGRETQHRAWRRRGPGHQEQVQARGGQVWVFLFLVTAMKYTEHTVYHLNACNSAIFSTFVRLCCHRL